MSGPGARTGAQDRTGGPAGRPALLDRRVVWLLLGLAALLWSLYEAGVFGADLVNEGGWGQVREFLRAALRPEVSDRFLRTAARATFVTLAFAVCGTFFSLVIGSLGGVLASETWWRSLYRARRDGWRGGFRAPWMLVRGVLALPRAIHEILWGLFFINVIGLDPLVGVLAIAIPYGAITAKVFSEIMDEAEQEGLEALLNRGVSTPKAFLYGLLPEAFPDLLSYAFYRFECSIRSAAVLGIIGAGGLGYQIFLSLQSLRYDQMWTFVVALLLLTGATDLWSGLVRRRLGSPHRIDISLGDRPVREPASRGWPPWGTAEPEASPAEGAPTPGGGGAEEERAAAEAPGTGEGRGGRPRQDPVIRWSLVGGGLLLLVAFWYVGPRFGQLVEVSTLASLGQVAEASFPPSLGGLTPWEVVQLSAKTLAMSILAITGAAVGGVLFSFPGATNFLLPGGILLGERRQRLWSLLGSAVFALTRGLLLFLRAVPAPIWALILLFVFFPGILPGAIALGLYTMGVLGRLMAEVTENLDARPLRALKAQGASGWQVFLYGVLPATLPRYLAYILYRWEVAIRATVMVGLVGAGGLGRVLTEQLSSFAFDAVTTTLLCYVALTFLVDMTSAMVRRDVR